MNAISKNRTMQNNQRGQSIVEISLITPLLLIALYIPADFGVSFFMGNLLQTAAREGARIGSGLQKSGSVPNLIFSSAEADTVKTEVINRLPGLSDKQDCHSNLLHRNGLHGIRRGDGPGSIQFFHV